MGERIAALCRRHETEVVAGLMVLLCATNLLTATRSPTVWMDEVLMVDPGVKLALQGTFSTTAWPQSRAEVFGSYSPLYPLLLAAWLKVFAFGVLAVRALPIVAASLAGFLFWRFLRFGHFVQSAVLRCLAPVLLISAYGVSFMYRCGRGDIVGVVVLLSALNFTQAASPAIRRAGLGVCAFLLPAAGNAHCVFAALVCGAWVISVGRRVLADVAVFVTGALCGGIVLFSALFLNGSVHHYTEIVRMNFAEHDTVVGLRDPSLFAIAAACSLALWRGRGRGAWRHPAVLAALIVAVASPIVLWMLVHFPLYYNWTLLGPALFATLHLTDRASDSTGRRRMVIIAGLVISVMFGVPARTANALLEWNSRRYALVERFVRDHVGRADVVAADDQGYYALEKDSVLAFYPLSWESISAGDRSRVTAALVAPPQIRALKESFPGDWVEIARMAPSAAREALRARAYELVALRRTRSAALPAEGDINVPIGDFTPDDHHRDHPQRR